MSGRWETDCKTFKKKIKKRKPLHTEAQAEVLTHTLLCDQHIPADKERLLLYAAPFTAHIVAIVTGSLKSCAGVGGADPLRTTASVTIKIVVTHFFGPLRARPDASKRQSGEVERQTRGPRPLISPTEPSAERWPPLM